MNEFILIRKFNKIVRFFFDMEFITIIFLIVFLIGIIISYWVGYKSGAFRKDRFWRQELPSHRQDAVTRSRAVLRGHFSEQLAPYMPGFKYAPTECKFLGKPVDLIVFNGLDNKEIDEIVFVEVKTGKSKLSSVENKLKKAIEEKRVRWEEYRAPEEVGEDFEL